MLSFQHCVWCCMYSLGSKVYVCFAFSCQFGITAMQSTFRNFFKIVLPESTFIGLGVSSNFINNLPAGNCGHGSIWVKGKVAAMVNTRLYVCNVDFHVRKYDTCCIFLLSKPPRPQKYFSMNLFWDRINSMSRTQTTKDVRDILEGMGVGGLIEVQQFRSPQHKWREGRPPVHCTLFLQFTDESSLNHCWNLIDDKWVDGLSSCDSRKSFLVWNTGLCVFISCNYLPQVKLTSSNHGLK